MDNTLNFYTLAGYSRLEKKKLTASMEDYLEMILRLGENGQPVRIHQLSEALHVKASSASKMVSNLKEQGLVDFERYGVVFPTQEGKDLGAFLLFRHQTLQEFFCFLNQSDDELEQVEKVEHFISIRTLENMRRFLDQQK
ncbi:metal-dependent transcriptional regulator [Hominifimenecus sp. rT4P-3]|uniref:metal-dependent transcriptional regulator n=1 Tax=Hominifimenecus sp. rT4P-3 TaxID=3242979 RepID=UPI003DA6A8D3